MGIRFDRDTRRATNGPLIFFNDPVSELSFAEEVRGAINSGLSFYSYRLPGAAMISFGSSEGFVEGIGVPGFVIGRFDPKKTYITIPYRGCNRNSGMNSDYRMPEMSCSKEDYIHEVEEIILSLKELSNGKVVASRVVVEETSVDLAHIFFDFCKRFPQSYIFCFSTPLTGCWIGASPELLLESQGGLLSTMSLAGTRPAGYDLPWDKKNIEEQKIVTDYILSVMEASGLNPIVRETYSKRSGNIEHICTPLSATLENVENFNIEDFLHTFSPTPALCGYPKDYALSIIESLEKFDRGCYGGFCGPYHSIKDFTFNVILRCAAVSEKHICIYAGGGITARSFPPDEWIETESKIKSTFGSEIS